MGESRTEMFRKLLDKDPENPMVLCSLGIQLFKDGRYPDAARHLEKAIQNKPDYSVAYRMLGRARYELHENAEARRVFEEGRRVAEANGDLQTVREIDVFLRRLAEREGAEN